MITPNENETFSVLQEKARLSLLSAIEPRITVTLSKKGGLEKQVLCFWREIPFYMLPALRHAGKHTWEHMDILHSNTVKNSETIAPQSNSAVVPIIRNRRNREHEKAFIVLHEQTTCTCSETGISYSVNLPCPEKLNLSIVHPLSFFSNVHDLLSAYYRKGIKIESELSNQILSGMLITILKHKKLLICRDYVEANICLQRCRPETLSHAVRFFHSLPSAVYLPQLHLVPEALYDFYQAPLFINKEQIIADRIEVMLFNFIKVCKGEKEDSNRIAGTILKTKTEKTAAKIRVYSGGNVALEAKQANVREKLARQLLEKLQKEHKVSEELISKWEVSIDAFLFLAEEKRKEIANQISNMFPGNKTASELARLFETTKTATLEMGLLSFSQELEKDLNEFKQTKKKYDFMAKLQIKKGS